MQHLDSNCCGGGGVSEDVHMTAAHCPWFVQSESHFIHLIFLQSDITQEPSWDSMAPFPELPAPPLVSELISSNSQKMPRTLIFQKTISCDNPIYASLSQSVTLKGLLLLLRMYFNKKAQITKKQKCSNLIIRNVSGVSCNKSLKYSPHECI